MLYPIFSNLTDIYIYAYLIVDFSEDEYQNFVRNNDIVLQISELPKINSSLNPEFSRLKNERRESPSNLTKSAIVLLHNFSTSILNYLDLCKFQYKSLIHYIRNRNKHFIVYSTC